MAGIEILYIVALAGRADKGAAPTAQAGLRKCRPFGSIEKLVRFARAERRSIERGKRELFHPFADKLLLLLCGCLIGIFSNGVQFRKKLASLFGSRIEQKIAAGDPAGYIPCRLGGVYAERAAEAGFFRLCAGKRHY